MHFSKKVLKQKLAQSLPGRSSHIKMATKSRLEEMKRVEVNLLQAKKSAVMILLFHEDEKLKVIFIRRSHYVGVHAGQIAFPGGRFEEEDVDVKNTALREIQEEIGITADQIEILGRITDIYVPPSNFLISVFVGYLNAKPVYTLDKYEVAEIIEIELEDFFADDVIQEKEFIVPSDNYSVLAPYYKVANAEVWGASAMVMTELLDILQKNQEQTN